jgi:hypothetical protein
MKNPQKPTKNKSQQTETTNTKRAIFTYMGKNTRTVTNILRKAGIKIAFSTKHTINNLLKQKQVNNNIFDNSGIYQLECKECDKKYIGQTGPSFKTRFKEHTRDYETNAKKSLYAKHLLEEKHKMESIDDTMTIMSIQKKGPMMNTIEQYHIYELTKTGNHLNEQFTEKPNPIFETVIKTHHGR